MPSKNAKILAGLVLMLPATGCASDAVNVTAKECAYDFYIDDGVTNLDTIPNAIVVRIDTHDELYERWCLSTGNSDNSN